MQGSFLLKREITTKLVVGKMETEGVGIHFHSHIEIYLVKSGEIEVIVNDKRKTLGKGELSVALSYDSHGFKNTVGSDAIILIIPTSWCSEFLSASSGKRLESPFIDDERVYNTVLSAMENLMVCGNELSKRGQNCVVLGAILDKMTSVDDNSSPSHSFSAEILIYISEHFKEELTLPDLSRKFGYNPSYLSRMFRSAFGISFVEYLTMLRLREAILLLRSGKKSVTECAMESGFGSMRSFYRAFSEEFGVTPKEYLKQLNAN